MIKHKYNNLYFYIIGAILICIEAFIILYNSASYHSVWYDEAYTIALIKYPIEDIWKITSTDVHPPLYYYMLKIFCGIFGEYYPTMRIFSGLGIVACLFLALFPVRRLLGNKTALTFMVLLIVIPISQYLSTEIRMYSWAMFFVLGCAVFAYKVYLRKVFINYILMMLFAIGAIYTHYYALVSVGVIYILLSIALLQKGRNIVRLVLFGLIILLIYSPWIPIFIRQIQNVRYSFWVETPTPKDYLLFLYYFFSPKEPSHPYTIFNLPVMAAALSIMLVFIGIGILYIIKLPKDKRLAAAHAFVLVYIVTILVTLCITYVVKPISVPRYTSCMLGPLLLGTAIYCTELWKHNKKALVSASFCLLTILCVGRFFSESKYNKEQFAELSKINGFLHTGRKVREPKAVISGINSYPELALLSVLLPNRDYYIYSPGDATSYKPFEIIVIDSIPHGIDSFFLIQSENDSSKINNNYTISNELLLKEKSIRLLNRIK